VNIDLSKRPISRFHFAIPGMILASIFNASMGAFVKLAAHNLSIEAITFWRNFISLVLFFPWVLWIPPRGHIREKLHTTQWKMLFIRSISGLISVVLFFYSLKFLPLANSVLLFNTMPLFVPFVSYFWQGFPIFHRLWWGIGCAFLGIIFILNPGGGVFHWATLMGLGSGLMAAIAMVALRMSHYSEPSYRTIFYVFLIGSFLMLITTFFNFHANWHAISFSEAGFLAGVGISGLVYQALVTWAAKHGPMRLISSFAYSGVLFSVFLDYWIWNLALPLDFFLGFILIVVGATLITVLYPKKDV